MKLTDNSLFVVCSNFESSNEKVGADLHPLDQLDAHVAERKLLVGGLRPVALALEPTGFGFVAGHHNDGHVALPDHSIEIDYRTGQRSLRGDVAAVAGGSFYVVGVHIVRAGYARIFTQSHTAIVV